MGAVCIRRSCCVSEPVAMYELRAFLQQSNWTFAKTMTTTPLAYTLRVRVRRHGIPRRLHAEDDVSESQLGILPKAISDFL